MRVLVHSFFAPREELTFNIMLLFTLRGRSFKFQVQLSEGDFFGWTFSFFGTRFIDNFLQKIKIEIVVYLFRLLLVKRVGNVLSPSPNTFK